MLTRHEPVTAKRGFTILEIILVIAVIGLLAAMLFPSVTGLGNKAGESTAASDAAVINRLLDGIDSALDATGEPSAVYADISAVATALEGSGTTIVVNGDPMNFRLPDGKTVPLSLNFVAGRVSP